MSKDDEQKEKQKAASKKRLKAGDLAAVDDHWEFRRGLSRAISEDLQELSMALAKKAQYEIGRPLWGRIFDRAEVFQIVSEALNYVIEDEKWEEQEGDACLSYWAGMDTVFWCYQEMREGDGGELARIIQSCQVALICRGHSDLAVDIARFAGAFGMLVQAEKRDGNVTMADVPDFIEQFKILFLLARYLREGKVPTKKALLSELGGDPYTFSRRIKKMRVLEYLPEEKRSRGRPGEVKQATVVELKIAHPSSGYSGHRQKQEIQLLSSIDVLSNNNPKMEDQDIRIIKERLGPLYPLMLWMFEIDELENMNDIIGFETKLRTYGLSLVR